MAYLRGGSGGLGWLPLALLVLVCPAAGWSAASAQSPEPLPQRLLDERVRLWDVTGVVHDGIFTGASNGLARLEGPQRQTVAEVRIAELTAVQLYRGQERRVVQGILIGVLGGAALGAVVGAIDGGGECNIIACGRAEHAAFGAAAFGIIGLPLGALIGASTVRDVWEDVPIGGAADAMARPVQVR